MTEQVIHDDETMTQWLSSRSDGDVLRTRYKGTQGVLDGNARLRNEAPKSFKQDGVEFHHACRVPWELYDMLRRRFGREPTAVELIQFSQDRDYNQLKTREVKL